MAFTVDVFLLLKMSKSMPALLIQRLKDSVVKRDSCAIIVALATKSNLP